MAQGKRGPPSRSHISKKSNPAVCTVQLINTSVEVLLTILKTENTQTDIYKNIGVPIEGQQK